MHEWSAAFALLDPKVRLVAWLTFHALVPGPAVPPLPPMVLQMLNRASVDLRWKLELNETRQRVVSAIGGRGSIALTLDEYLRPNWWRSLELRTPIDADALDAVPLRFLRLDVVECPLTERMVHAVPCCSVRRVNLERSSSATLANAALLPKVTRLTLVRCAISGDHLCALSRLELLTTLTIFACADLKTLAFLSDSPSLTSLSVCEGAVTSLGLVGLERIPTLKRLTLRRCDAVTAVNCLAESTSLEELSLRFSSSVTSEGLVGLERIPTLKKLIFGVVRR